MGLSVVADPVPLTTWGDGVVRVGKTRVTLDSVVSAFVKGASLEDIARRYPSLELADVYAVIAYYLRHHADVESYLRDRERQRAEVRWENELRFDPAGVKERLLVRRMQERRVCAQEASIPG